MRLTQYTDFSIRVLIYLALQPGRRCTIQEIADGYGISRNHLMKVVQQLAQAGYVESSRGAGGGLRLGRPPGEINMGRVIEEMEPDLGLVECFRDNNQCVITPACRLPLMLARARGAFLDVLREHKLSDLLDDEIAQSARALLCIHVVDEQSPPIEMTRSDSSSDVSPVTTDAGPEVPKCNA